MTPTTTQPLSRTSPPIRRVRCLAAAGILLAAAVTGPAAASAQSRLVATTTQHGVQLRLSLPAARWHLDERVSGTVRVKNTNDRTVWYADIRCRDVAVEARVQTDPDQGREWTGDRAAFKRLALSSRADTGPVVGNFTVEGYGDCAEPVAYSLPAGATRTYDVSWRVRHVGLGVSQLDVSATFQFEGFKKSDVYWPDRAPRPISVSLQVPVERKAARILTAAQAIDLGLAKPFVRRDIRDSEREGWSDVEMQLLYRSESGWEWRVDLFGHIEGTPADDHAYVVAGFVVDALNGAVTTD